MKILILGAGNMGAWFVESLCLIHDVAVFDRDKSRLRYFFNTHRFVSYEQIEAFRPEMVINAVSLHNTIATFNDILPYIPDNCILSDITSVKTGLPEFYRQSGKRFVSTHPMFGPTFGNLKELSTHSAIIITESDNEGKDFFREFYQSLKLNIYEYSFEDHDHTTAYSLSIPFVSTLVFGACMKHQEAPGTTFKKHLDIARGLVTEDPYLLSEILFNPYTLPQIKNIQKELDKLLSMVENKDTSSIHKFIAGIKDNIT